jgi:hypothetical protein
MEKNEKLRIGNLAKIQSEIEQKCVEIEEHAVKLGFPLTQKGKSNGIGQSTLPRKSRQPVTFQS